MLNSLETNALEQLLNSPVYPNEQSEYEAEVRFYQKTYDWHLAGEYIKSLVQPKTFRELIQQFITTCSSEYLPKEIANIKSVNSDLYSIVLNHMLQQSVFLSSYRSLDILLKEIKVLRQAGEFNEKYKVNSFLSSLMSSSNSNGLYNFDRDRFDKCIAIIISSHPHKSFKYFANNQSFEGYNAGLYEVCASLEKANLFEKQSRRAKIFKLLCDKGFMERDLHLMSKEQLVDTYPILRRLSDEDCSKLIASAKEGYEHQQTSGTRTTATIYAEKILSKIMDDNKNLAI